MDPKEEIKFLISLRVQINQRIKELRDGKDSPATVAAKKSWYGARTDNYVRAEKVRPFLQLWIDDGKPLIRLAEASGLAEKGLRNILAGVSEWTHQDTADKILQAMNMTHRYHELLDQGEEAI
jgi:hypothetical protein